MHCPSCGTDVKAGARFCPSCGTTIPAAPAAAQADVAKTMVAGMPAYSGNPAPPSQPTPQSPPPQQYAQQPQQYAQPQPQQYAQQPQQYAQQQQQQQYAQPPQQQYGQPQAAYGAQGYGVTSAPALGMRRGGRLGGILMVLSAIVMLVGLYLPYIDNNSLAYVLTSPGALDAAKENSNAALLFGVPALAGLSLLFGLIGLWRGGVIWGVLALLMGLIVGGFHALAWIGSNLDTSTTEAGTGLLLLAVGGLALFVCSIVYMAGKRRA